MINYNNMSLRNLEEQVLKNKEDIADFLASERVLADFGIRVIGQVNSADELDGKTGTAYGDAYTVGTQAPYVFYIWTRADLNAGHPDDYWLNIGQLAIIGPQGPQGEEGPQGIQGIRGSIWVTDYHFPTSSSFNENDQLLNPATGNIYTLQVDTNTGRKSWELKGNIIGPQGIQGPIGPQGIQGPIGPQGVQGPEGPAGRFINIFGIVNGSNQLPNPSVLNNLNAAYLVGAQSPYNLYIQVGNDPSTALWTDVGLFNTGTLVTANGGQYQATWDADTKISKSGDTMTGQLLLPEPTQLSSAARIQDVPLVVDEMIDAPTSHQNIVVGYTNSLDVGSFNRVPKVGERVLCLLKTSVDGYIFSVLLEITGGPNTAGYYPFVLREVNPMHENSNIENSAGLDSVQLKYTGTTNEENFANTNTGSNSVVFGDSNINRGKRNLLVGKLSVIDTDATNNIVGGTYNGNMNYPGIGTNPIKGNNNLIFGLGNSTDQGKENIMGGRYNLLQGNGEGNIITGTGQATRPNKVIGHWNMVSLGNNGTADNIVINGQHNIVSTAGETNINGNFASVVGLTNKVTNNTCTVHGSYNTASAAGSTIFGNRNSNANGNSAFSILAGEYLSGSTVRAQAIFGRYNKQSATAQLIVGGGTADTNADRKNLFEVHKDGTVKAYDSSTNSMKNLQKQVYRHALLMTNMYDSGLEDHDWQATMTIYSTNPNAYTSLEDILPSDLLISAQMIVTEYQSNTGSVICQASGSISLINTSTGYIELSPAIIQYPRSRQPEELPTHYEIYPSHKWVINTDTVTEL